MNPGKVSGVTTVNFFPYLFLNSPSFVVASEAYHHKKSSFLSALRSRKSGVLYLLYHDYGRA